MKHLLHPRPTLLVTVLVGLLAVLAGCEYLAEALNANVNENAGEDDATEACTVGDCPDGQYCHFADGTCDDPDRRGECTDIPITCPATIDRVCACDGQTYDNACEAAQAGESIDFEGRCE